MFSEVKRRVASAPNTLSTHTPSQLARVLKNDGVFILFSCGEPENRQKAINRPEAFGWELLCQEQLSRPKVVAIPKDMDKQYSDDEGPTDEEGRSLKSKISPALAEKGLDINQYELSEPYYDLFMVMQKRKNLYEKRLPRAKILELSVL